MKKPPLQIPADDLRFEVKMTAPESFAPRLDALLRVHPRAISQLHPPRWVNNIYFDSRELSRLNQNYAGIYDRCKLRYRWYGQVLDGHEGHVELKIKHGKLGWKQNYSCPSIDLATMPWQRVVGVIHRSIPEATLTQIRNLEHPVLINQYHRRYLSTADRKVRITIDTHQRYFNQWSTTMPNLKFPSQSPGTLVVEVKANRSHSDDVRRVIETLPLRISRNSKYVEGCEHLTSLG